MPANVTALPDAITLGGGRSRQEAREQRSPVDRTAAITTTMRAHEEQGLVADRPDGGE